MSKEKGREADFANVLARMAHDKNLFSFRCSFCVDSDERKDYFCKSRILWLSKSKRNEPDNLSFR